MNKKLKKNYFLQLREKYVRNVLPKNKSFYWFEFSFILMLAGKSQLDEDYYFISKNLLRPCLTPISINYMKRKRN